MPNDGYLYVTPRPGSPDIITEVLAWSWSFDSMSHPAPRPPLRRGRRRNRLALDYAYAADEGEWEGGDEDGQQGGGGEEPAADPMRMGDVRGWSAARTVEWLADTMHMPQYVKPFTENMVDGEVLLELDEDDLKESLGVTVIGHRIKILNAIRKARYYQKRRKPAVAENRFSATLFLDAASHKTLFTSVIGGTPLYSVVLVNFIAKNRHSVGDDEDDASSGIKPAEGQPVHALEMRNVSCSSISAGGSGGEDRFTCSIDFTPTNFSIHYLGVHDCSKPDLLYNYFLSSPVDPSVLEPTFCENHNLMDYAPGISLCVVDGKLDTLEWGKAISWSPKNHKAYPRAFRSMVFLLLLMHRRKECPLHVLPLHVLLKVFTLLSTTYQVNPFDKWPLPEPGLQKERD
ncbi:hypothetical protein Pelo_10503 [Pelomyxa schiedti]|nr:hypothetical protein Pelo_10503 [Pelomyxa schiedti]